MDNPPKIRIASHVRPGSDKPIHGFDEIYVVVKRAGGNPPTITLEFPNGGGYTYQVGGQDRQALAERLAAHLNETVKLKVEAWWNARTLELDNLVIHDLLEWKDQPLAEAYREHGNRLPIALSVKDLEELIADREADRADRALRLTDDAQG